MNKPLLFIASAAMLSMTAGAANPIAQQPEKSLVRQSLSTPLHKAPAMSRAEWVYDVTADDIIYDIPADAERKLNQRWCDYYSNSLWGVTQGSLTGGPFYTAETADGTVYLYNFFTGIDMRSWLKGQRDGDKMTFHLPQAVYTDSDSENTYVYVAQVCHFEADEDSDDGSGRYYANEGEFDLIFNKEGDTWVMQPYDEVNDHPQIVSLVSADDATWCAYSDWNISFKPFEAELVTPPADSQASTYQMVYQIEGAYNTGLYANVVADGNDVYVQGISTDFPDAWVKGTMADGKLLIPSYQYVGASEMSNYFGYFIGCTKEEKYNEEWGFTYTEYVPAANMELAIDGDKWTSDMSMVINHGTESVYMADCYDSPIITPIAEITDFTPANPVPSYYSPYNPDYGYGQVYFDFPTLNKDGQLLDTANLYYSVYVDGELFEFYSDEYEGVEDGTTRIPFDFANGWSLGYYGPGNVTHWYQYYFDGAETLGFQTIYADGENEYASDIVQFNISSKVNSLEAEDAASVVYYDLTGRRVNNPANGLYIKVATYADGHKETSKLMLTK